MDIVWILLSIPVILGIGFTADSIGVFPPERRKVVNAIAYYIALPALLFTSTADRSFGEIFTADLVLGVVLAMGATMVVAWFIHRRTTDVTVRSVAMVQSYHSNFGYMGVPLVAIIFGEVATGRAALILGLGSIIQISVTMSILSGIGETQEYLDYIREILINPIMIALIVGFAVAIAQITVPDTSWVVLSGIGELALPLALICTGAALTIESESLDYRLAGRVISAKVVLMPIITYVVFLLLGADGPTIRAAVLMFAMPSAVSTYVFASEMGGDRTVASMNVFLTTVISTATLFVVVWLLFMFT